MGQIYFVSYQIVKSKLQSNFTSIHLCPKEKPKFSRTILRKYKKGVFNKD